VREALLGDVLDESLIKDAVDEAIKLLQGGVDSSRLDGAASAAGPAA